MSEYDPLCRVGMAIVEDEKDLVTIYERIFSKWGIFICFIAFDGLEAVKKFIECTPKPHVVLMDYRLPVMNGVEATKEILKTDPDVRIVFLSADAGVKDEAMRAGAFIFLIKPAGIKDIVGAVESAFGKPLQKQV